MRAAGPTRFARDEEAPVETFLMRGPGPDLARGERTFVPRGPVDSEAARRQHRRLRERLEALGARVRLLPPLPGHPDAAFVEDVALVLPELLVACRPGAASRRGEVRAALETLAGLVPASRPRRRVEPPGMLEGGDVVVVGRTLLVGLSSRTDAAGARQLAGWARPRGYRVRTVRVEGALHLKTACCHVGAGLLLCNPEWVSGTDLDAARDGRDVREVMPVSEGEPWAANALVVGGAVVTAEGAPRTAGRLGASGRRVETVDLSQFARAEAGVTCLALRIR